MVKAKNSKHIVFNGTGMSDELFQKYIATKTELKASTLTNYKYMYNNFVQKQKKERLR